MPLTHEQTKAKLLDICEQHCKINRVEPVTAILEVAVNMQLVYLGLFKKFKYQTGIGNWNKCKDEALDIWQTANKLQKQFMGASEELKQGLERKGAEDVIDYIDHLILALNEISSEVSQMKSYRHDDYPIAVCRASYRLATAIGYTAKPKEISRTEGVGLFVREIFDVIYANKDETANCVNAWRNFIKFEEQGMV